jgi:hypothetical protein
MLANIQNLIESSIDVNDDKKSGLELDTFRHISLRKIDKLKVHNVRIHHPKLCTCRYLSHIPKIKSHVLISCNSDRRQFIYYPVHDDNSIFESVSTNMNLLKFVGDSNTGMCNDSLRIEPNGCLCVIGDPETIEYLCLLRKGIYDHIKKRKNNNKIVDIAQNMYPCSLKRSRLFKQELSNLGNKKFHFNIRAKLIIDLYSHGNLELKTNDPYMLLIHENYGNDLGLSGGKRKFGETSVECAHRETCEELLIDFDYENFFTSKYFKKYIYRNDELGYHLLELPNIKQLQIDVINNKNQNIKFMLGITLKDDIIWEQRNDEKIGSLVTKIKTRFSNRNDTIIA